MGHRKLATVEALIASMFWLASIAQDPESPTRLGMGVVVGVVVAFVHVPDPVGTWFLARRGVFPESEGRRAADVRTAVEGREPAAHAG